MNRLEKNQKIIWLLKALLFSYVVTGISLLLLSVLLYKFEWNEHLVSAAIVAVYVLSTVVGGIVIGKLVRTRTLFLGTPSGKFVFYSASGHYDHTVSFAFRKWA